MNVCRRHASDTTNYLLRTQMRRCLYRLEELPIRLGDCTGARARKEQASVATHQLHGVGIQPRIPEAKSDTRSPEMRPRPAASYATNAAFALPILRNSGRC